MRRVGTLAFCSATPLDWGRDADDDDMDDYYGGDDDGDDDDDDAAAADDDQHDENGDACRANAWLQPAQRKLQHSLTATMVARALMESILPCLEPREATVILSHSHSSQHLAD